MFEGTIGVASTIGTFYLVVLLYKWPIHKGTYH